jgi:hypothetical protein
VSEQPVYVPVLKGKEGEFAALETLSADVIPLIAPLIEIPSVPYDYVNERPARSIDEHVAGIADRLERCWPGRALYLDFSPLDEDDGPEGGRVLGSVLGSCVQNNVQVAPVVSRRNSAGYIAAAGAHASDSSFGSCVRFLVEDFEDDVDLDGEVDQLLAGLGSRASSSPLDLVLDLQDLGPDSGKALLVARSIFSMIPRKEIWRRIVLVAASFPEDLSDVSAATIATLPRREWELWKTLQRRPNALPRRDMIFGDYAIAHPVQKELDPRIMLMSASIRYTTQANWLVVKGRNVRQYGFDQYFDLCKTLVSQQEYSGSQFSWGDQYIYDCAAAIKGPGNATTWRKVGTNHHLSLVARQLANLLPDA